VNGLLLDTHAWLWAITSPDKIPKHARNRITSYDGPVYLSTISVMEMAIKASLGKLILADADIARFVTRVNAESDIRLLDVSLPQIAALQSLPWRHRDPFDRMLIAQANVMSLSIVTRDPSFTLYDVNIVWDRAK
jgi:PIN domain nuclease of toxin-antitoxin system